MCICTVEYYSSIKKNSAPLWVLIYYFSKIFWVKKKKKQGSKTTTCKRDGDDKYIYIYTNLFGVDTFDTDNNSCLGEGCWSYGNWAKEVKREFLTVLPLLNFVSYISNVKMWLLRVWWWLFYTVWNQGSEEQLLGFSLNYESDKAASVSSPHSPHPET